VAGVRLVSTYRDIFAEKVRDAGIDGLIKSLADGNRGGASRFNSIKNSFWEKSHVLYAIFQNLFRRRQAIEVGNPTRKRYAQVKDEIRTVLHWLSRRRLRRAGGRAQRAAASVTLEVIAAMKHERDQHGGNANQIAGLVETKIMPLVDFSRMTQIAVARNWRAGDAGTADGPSPRRSGHCWCAPIRGAVQLSRPGDRIQGRARAPGDTEVTSSPW